MIFDNPATIGSLYFLIYLLLITLLTIKKYRVIGNYHAYEVIYRKYDYKEIFLISLFLAVFLGFRPYEGFGDTGNYIASYMRLRDFGVFNVAGDESPTKDYLFYMYEKICATIIDGHVWLASICFFYIFFMLFGCRKIDLEHGAILMLFCLGSFEFFSYAVNGIRNGVACSFIIFALGCICRKKVLYAVVCSCIAIGCHKSVFLPVVSMFAAFFLNRPKFMFSTWIVAVVLSLFLGGIFENLMVSLNFDDRLFYNLRENEADGMILEHSFRWDFLIYSFLPILLGWYSIVKRKLFDRTYLITLGTYIYANAFWVLSISAIFSNRIAYLSWFIYPIVLAYPLLNFPVFRKQHSKKTAAILLLHLLLTIFMWIKS